MGKRSGTRDPLSSHAGKPLLIQVVSSIVRSRDTSLVTGMEPGSDSGKLKSPRGLLKRGLHALVGREINETDMLQE